MDRDDICINASSPDIDGTRLCGNHKSQKYFNELCPGVHACPDGVILKKLTIKDIILNRIEFVKDDYKDCMELSDGDEMFEMTTTDIHNIRMGILEDLLKELQKIEEDTT